MRVNNHGTVSSNLREFHNQTGGLESALRESATELRNVEDAIAYAEEEGKERDEIAGAKFNLAQIALRLDGEVEKFSKLIENVKRIAGRKYLENAVKPIVRQN